MPERQLILRIRQLAQRTRNPAVARGMGDDCAIVRVPSGQELLATTDLCIEGVHFRREWHPARSVGHRCLARGLSDIAAMGGDPIACFLSIGVPDGLSQKWVDAFVRGLLSLAKKYDVTLAGGDTSSAEKITADIMVLGKIPAGRALLRSGTRPGDLIYVTGKLGQSAAVLRSLYDGRGARGPAARGHFYPTPRLETGRWLREKKLATAAIDISDGLSVDLAHICEESGVSALVEASAVPVGRPATFDYALHGGEDYELLFTARPTKRVPDKIVGVTVSKIGEIRKRAGGRDRVFLRHHNGKIQPLPPKGWEHFGKI